MKINFAIVLGALILLVLGACQINEVSCDTACKSDWIDGGKYRDSCANDGNTQCLVSKRVAKPSSAELEKPVFIAVHGFSTSTYEWDEFKKFVDTLRVDTATGSHKAAVSLVLLGGHGRDIDTFQLSTWPVWGKPILAEYDSLVSKGYKNINFAAGSTGASLLLEYIAEGAFNTRQSPNRIFMIDPIIVPTAKILSLIQLVGPVIGNFPDEGTKEETKHWYVNRPEEDLNQLYRLMNGVQRKLESGFSLPKHTLAKVFKSVHDGSADPISALLVYQGLSTSSGANIDVEMVDSRLHVFTRLQGRSSLPSNADTLLQQKVFKEMVESARSNWPRL